MLLSSLGQTRTVVRREYALLSPDSFVRAPLPGMVRCTAIVHAAPAMGAGFTQYTAEFEAKGVLGDTPGERFVYVLSGNLTLHLGGRKTSLAPGAYAFLPEGCEHRLEATKSARAAVIERKYCALTGVPHPEAFTGHESEIKPTPLANDKSIGVQSLIPADVSFDMAVNLMTYAPGASLPLVESHVMEHGLLMLDGGGIYRLGNDWHPTTAGDFIWMAPYCPQWFGALGKEPSRYLIYKDWNRHHLASGLFAARL